jgi:hypothetical protein
MYLNQQTPNCDTPNILVYYIAYGNSGEYIQKTGRKK